MCGGLTDMIEVNAPSLGSREELEVDGVESCGVVTLGCCGFERYFNSSEMGGRESF